MNGPRQGILGVYRPGRLEAVLGEGELAEGDDTVRDSG